MKNKELDTSNVLTNS